MDIKLHYRIVSNYYAGYEVYFNITELVSSFNYVLILAAMVDERSQGSTYAERNCPEKFIIPKRNSVRKNSPKSEARHCLTLPEAHTPLIKGVEVHPLH